MKILIGLIACGVCLLLLLFALPFLIDLNRYQDRYRPIIETALNRKVQLQDIRLTIWPRLGVRLAGVTIHDDPRFSDGPFLSLTSLDIGVKLLPLLSRRVEVASLTLRDPVITIIADKRGVMNVSTIGAAPSPSGPSTQERPQPSSGNPLQMLALLAVDRLAIDGGTVLYRDLSTTPNREYQLREMALLLTEVRLGQTPAIHLKTTVLPWNLPVTLDGRLGPLRETLEFEGYHMALAIGGITLNVKGALVGGILEATLSSPAINTADLPLALPLQKPVQINDLLMVAKAPFPLPQTASPLELAEIPNLSLTLNMGRSIIAVTGTVLDGQATVTVSAPSLTTTDLPVAIPLTKPVVLNDLSITAKTRVPFRPTAPPLEIADVPTLQARLVLGRSVVAVTGTVRNGQGVVTLTSPSLQTHDLPVDTGLAQSMELKDLLVRADLKGQAVRVPTLSFHLFDGQVKGEGDLTLGTPAPPFHGKLRIDGLRLRPALAAVTPESAVSLSGTAALDLMFTGRGFSAADMTTALEGRSHLRIKDGKIEGIDLLEDAIVLLNAAGLPTDRPKGTLFSTMETDLVINQGLVVVQKFDMVSRDFQATGRGTVRFDQTLDLVLDLHLSQPLTQKLVGASSVAKLAMKDGRLTLPLQIGGTVQRPSYTLNTKGLTRKVQEQAQEKARETIKGLLEGTTTPRDFKEQGKDLLKGLLGR